MSRGDPAVDRAVQAARRGTDSGLDEAQLDAVFARVRSGMAQRPAPRHEPRLWRVGALASAALVLVVLGVRSLRAPIEPDAAAVLLSSGAVDLRDEHGAPLAGMVDLPPRFELTLADRGRAVLALGERGRVAMGGPGGLRRKGGILEVSAGEAMFDVQPQRPGRRLRVRAGDRILEVRGTRFVVAVEGGALREARVIEGKVAVLSDAGEREQELAAGQSLRGESSAAAFSGAAVWDWLARPDSRADSAQLVVQSSPPGAQVELDGAQVGTTPLTVRWKPGAVRLEVTLAGFAPYSRKLELSGGSRIEDVVVLAPLLESPPAPPPPRRTAGALLGARGLALLNAKRCADLQREVTRLQSRIADDNERAQAGNLAAECWIRKGDKRRALEAYGTVVIDYSGTLSAETARFERGKLLAELGDAQAALAALREYLDRHPTGPFAAAAAFRRCELLLTLNERAQAGTCLETFARTFPSGERAADAVFLLATLARLAGDWPAAARSYGDYVTRMPGGKRVEEALYYRVDALARGRLECLVDAARRYLEAFPTGAHAEEVRRLSPAP